MIGATSSSAGVSLKTPDNYIPTALASGVNNLISAFKTATAELNVPLGSQYSNFNVSDAAAHLQLHRLHKKFQVVNNDSSQTRKTNTIRKVVDYDNDGITQFNPNTADVDIKHLLYNARLELHEAIRSHYHPGPDGVCLPSGESYVTASGDVSAFRKLSKADYWTCTPANFDNFARTVYNHTGLKHAARKHFATYESKRHTVAPGVYEYRKFDNNAMWLALEDYKPHKRRFLIFKAKLRCVVTFVDVCRMTTVPKDNEDDRVIICSNFCNMIEQLKIHSAIWSLVEDQYSIKLEDSQILHQALLADDTYSTIDFSNASNSVYYAVVKWFLEGTRLWKDIVASREATVELPDGSYHGFTMLSPMGNGYTFAVMTLLILSIARQLDSCSYVFGDDLMISSDVAHTCVSVLDYIGFKVNTKKTFLSGSFKESCGGFISGGTYLTSFDIHYNFTDLDAVITVNKVGIIAYSYPTKFTHLWRALHSDLLELFPPHMQRGYNFKPNHAELKLRLDIERIQRKRRNANTLTPLNTLTEATYDDIFPSLPPLGEGVFNHPRLLRKLQNNDSRVKRCLARLGKPHNNDSVNFTLCFEAENEIHRYKPSQPNRKGDPWIPVHNAPLLLGLCWINDGKSGPVKFKQTYIRSVWRRLPVHGGRE